MEGTGEIGGEGVGGVEGLKEGVKEVPGGARGASELPGNAESSVQEETEETEETTTSSGAELNSSTAPVVVPKTDTASDPTSTAPGTVLEGYQKVEFAALYYQSATGYYYDPATQQFFAPVAGGRYQATGQASIGSEQSSGLTTVADYTLLSAPSINQSDPTGLRNGQTGSNLVRQVL